MMQNVLTGSSGQHLRVQFDVAGCNRDQKLLFQLMKASSILSGVTSLGRVDPE